MGSIEKKIMSMLPEAIAKPLKKYRKNQILQRWYRAGSPIPPPHQVKQVAIETYSTLYHCKTLIETGTYLGDMIQAQKGNFQKLYSIELSKELWEKAVARFKNDKHVQILNGDSEKVLVNLVPAMNEPVLFWLDGHYSGGVTAKGETDCPIFGEIDSILTPAAPLHVMLIDDARLFNGTQDYPTIPELEKYVFNKKTNYVVEVKDDIIRITPRP